MSVNPKKNIFIHNNKKKNLYKEKTISCMCFFSIRMNIYCCASLAKQYGSPVLSSILLSGKILREKISIAIFFFGQNLFDTCQDNGSGFVIYARFLISFCTVIVEQFFF